MMSVKTSITTITSIVTSITNIPYTSQILTEPNYHQPSINLQSIQPKP
jgi:hypothetical protein